MGELMNPARLKHMRLITDSFVSSSFDHLNSFRNTFNPFLNANKNAGF